ncbi:MAG: hypothetical protein VW146_02260 [Gammaproteobacteria bacterium]
MYENAKQARSIKRIDALLTTANQLLLEGAEVSDITIALLSQEAGLKRTSTYKFFQTPEEIKSALASKYFAELTRHIKESPFSLEQNTLNELCKTLVNECFNFFQLNLGATKLLLGNSFLYAVDKEVFKEFANTNLNKFESKTTLPNMFDKQGVFLVTSQLLLAVMSLNYRQNNLLNEIGKKEALRAAYAYLLSCTTK